MPIFMKMEGVDGEVTFKGYEGWIELESASWGVTQEGGKTTFNTMNIVVGQSKGTPKMFLNCATGALLKLTNIVLVDDSDTIDGPYEAYRYNLRNVYITSFSISQAQDDIAPTPIDMNLAFSYMFYQVKYKDSKGMLITQSAYYDLGTPV